MDLQPSIQLGPLRPVIRAQHLDEERQRSPASQRAGFTGNTSYEEHEKQEAYRNYNGIGHTL